MGALCDNKDLFHVPNGEEKAPPPCPSTGCSPRRLHSGDFLALLDVRAYNRDIQHNFNERLIAGAVFIDKGGRANLIGRRQEYENLLAYKPHSRGLARRVTGA